MNIGRAILILAAGGVLAFGCTKQEEPGKTTDERLGRPYCNDPEAVNYNWDFPGTPNNSVCFYPDEMFKGSYRVFDTTYDADFNADTTSYKNFVISLDAVTRSKMTLSGYILNSACTLNGLSITATRFYRASVDSAFLPPPDSMYLNGTVVCGKDTLSGNLSKKNKDSDTIHINFMVAVDSGLLFHRGIAIRQ